MTAKTHRLEAGHPPDGFVESHTILHMGNRYVATRHGQTDGPFNLTLVVLKGSWYSLQTSEPFGTVYYGPHPSVTAEDVIGAEYAWEEDGAWKFAHCSPDEQVDFAADVRTFALEQFTIALAKAHKKVHEATNPTLLARVQQEEADLLEVTEAVGTWVHKTVVDAVLGAYHKNPHHDYRRELTDAAIDGVLADLAEKGKTDLATLTKRSNVLAVMREVKRSLNTTHTIEDRATRAARLEAEKKAKEAEAATETETETPGA